jgi:hypothetical protein
MDETIGELSLSEQIIDDFLPVADKLKRSWNANLGKGTFEEKGIAFVILCNQDCLFVCHIGSVAPFFRMSISIADYYVALMECTAPVLAPMARSTCPTLKSHECVIHSYGWADVPGGLVGPSGSRRKIGPKH